MVVQVVHCTTVRGPGVGARSACQAVVPGLDCIHPEEVPFSQLHKSDMADSSPNNSLVQAGLRMNFFHISNEIKYQDTKRQRPKSPLFSAKDSRKQHLARTYSTLQLSKEVVFPQRSEKPGTLKRSPIPVLVGTNGQLLLRAVISTSHNPVVLEAKFSGPTYHTTGKHNS